MIGRGAVADPFLARRIRALSNGELLEQTRADDWAELLPLLVDFWVQVLARVEPRHAPGRLKLWLSSLRRSFIEAEVLYMAVRTLRGVEETTHVLEQHAGPAWRAAA
jgi:tRNA-dihydrouridine synthase C